MKHSKALALITFLISQLSLFAQSEIKGTVADAETGDSIPYANVYLKNHLVGVTAFRDGSFILKVDTLYQDSLVISCIGYKSKKVYLPQLVNRGQIEIKLEPSQEELAEVMVQPRKLKSLEVGLAKRRSQHDLGATAKRPYARYLENTYHLDGFISTVSVYVTTRGIPTAPFRINILAVDEVTGAPSEPLSSKDFIVQAKEGNEWVTIDVSKELISFPPFGFFVSIQALPLDSNQLAEAQKALPHLKPSLVEWYAPSFGHNYEPYSQAARYNWSFNWSQYGWEPYWRKLYALRDTLRGVNYMKSHSASSLMIKAEINYYADQEKKVKDLKSKRKVRKVLDLPKKNELEYSQSSPKDLLESIIKAVNKDEVGYLCAYLLYFDDEEELMSTLEAIEVEKAKSDSVIISSKEKVEIRKVLTGIEMELGKLQPTVGERFLYQLNHDGGTFYFQNKNGVWRMSPRRTQILRRDEELNIPERF